jgi:transglutaminase-like putative cysteine protease
MRLRRNVLLTAEFALLALTIIASISLERLFTDTSFLRELLILAIGSHAVAAVCRRAQLSMVWATVTSGLALVVLATAVFYPDNSALVFPNSETLRLLGDDLRDAWRVFGEDAAPVPPLRGFLVTTSVLTWYGVFLADWAAFRLRSPLEAVAPATSLFVFASLMGVDRNEIAHGAFFAAGLLAVLLAMRAERQVREEVWVADGAAAGVRSTLQIGGAAGVIAVILAAVVAPQVPGATAQPLVDITSLNDGPETRSVLSPLVEVSASLVNQRDVELFSVRVDRDQQDYWRMMALTKFEDEIWRRSSNFDEARGPVDSDIDASVPTTPMVQEFTITGLGNIYLPAAYEVSEVIDDGGVDLEYEVATGALVVERGLDQIPRDLTYTIESQVPDYSPADLPADATEGLGRGFVEEHTQLPASCGAGESTLDTGCWPTEVSDLAAEIVAGATTDYERVRALQSYFLDPARFTYDIDVALRHDINSMTEFLERGRGYCEQFASTFAAMARSLGIPSRVAVGFTWGEWSPTRNEFVVRGEHAHAWPEVYFAGVGWVIFDPTPGRSRGLDGDITGLDTPQQTGPQDDPDFVDDTPTTTTEPTTPDANRGDFGLPPRSTTTLSPAAVAGGPGRAAPPGDGGGSFPIALTTVLLGIVALVGFVPAVQYLRRRRRIGLVAADPVGRGEVAWDDALGALRLLGVTGSPGQTPHEFASMVEARRREIGPIRLLADEVTALRYSERTDAVAHALAAQDAAAEIVARCRRQVGRARLLGDALDPRTLLEPAPSPLSLRPTRSPRPTGA